mmetsp:Transcript_27976/g.88879  ORF Transcript_27976/g.88879 Transcript_27976/m.88879 type:complete len:212 (-) Transcript_27976:51-686(-)
MRDDYYDLLGVAEGASRVEVVAAFRRLSLKLHPDKASAAGISADEAAQAFAAAREAYEVLSDPAARFRYDERLGWIRSHPDIVRRLQPGEGTARPALGSSRAATASCPSLRALPAPTAASSLPFSALRAIGSTAAGGHERYRGASAGIVPRKAQWGRRDRRAASAAAWPPRPSSPSGLRPQSNAGRPAKPGKASTCGGCTSFEIHGTMLRQ